MSKTFLQAERRKLVVANGGVPMARPVRGVFVYKAVAPLGQFVKNRLLHLEFTG